MKNLKKQDPKIYKIIQDEMKRQEDVLELIPSESVASKAVLEALGSVLNNKYSEGYPCRRYYGGQENIDKVEILAQERAKKIFNVPHANVQPYSGSPANLAVYVAVCRPGDVTMGQNLPDGGHLTHGWKASATSIFYKPVSYHVKPDGYLDLAEIEKLALLHRPRLIWVGATAYVRAFPFEELSKIADSVDAYLAADIAHIAGLVAAGVHKSPVKFAHVITTTTHKTLCGPRGGMIMVTQKGLDKDPDLAKKIDKAIFPGFQGGPHMHQVAAIAVCLKEASTQAFKKYAKQIVKNAKALAEGLKKYDFKLISGGTDNHLILIDLRNKNVSGPEAQDLLEAAGITINKNSIPYDPAPPFKPSGIRMGTPAITTRGMKEKEMKKIAGWINEVISNPKSVKKVRGEIKKFCKKFPLPK